MLSQLDMETHSTFQVLRSLEKFLKFSLKGKDVLALGSHDFLEHDGFVHHGANNIWAVECNPYVLDDLRERVKNRENSHAIEACLWSTTGIKKQFHFFKDNKYGAGSLFENQKLTEYVPECKQLQETVTVETITFDNLAEREGIDTSNIGWLSLDVQGSELEVLKGAINMLTNKPEIIYCEVSWDNLYKDAPLMEEIDNFIRPRGYNRIGIRKDIEAQGDAIYVRI